MFKVHGKQQVPGIYGNKQTESKGEARGQGLSVFLLRVTHHAFQWYFVQKYFLL